MFYLPPTLTLDLTSCFMIKSVKQLFSLCLHTEHHHSTPKGVTPFGLSPLPPNQSCNTYLRERGGSCSSSSPLRGTRWPETRTGRTRCRSGEWGKENIFVSFASSCKQLNLSEKDSNDLPLSNAHPSRTALQSTATAIPAADVHRAAFPAGRPARSDGWDRGRGS